MKSTQKGFTLIELMIVIAIIAILAAIAIPAYSNYVKRSKVSSALGFAAAAKTAVAETYQSSGSLPTDNAAAGLDTADSINAKYVESVTVANGEITVALQGTDDTALDAASIILTPTESDGTTAIPNDGSYSGAIAWTCTVSDAGVTKYVPSTCRGTATTP